MWVTAQIHCSETKRERESQRPAVLIREMYTILILVHITIKNPINVINNGYLMFYLLNDWVIVNLYNEWALNRFWGCFVFLLQRQLVFPFRCCCCCFFAFIVETIHVSYLWVHLFFFSSLLTTRNVSIPYRFCPGLFVYLILSLILFICEIYRLFSILFLVAFTCCY